MDCQLGRQGFSIGLVAPCSPKWNYQPYPFPRGWSNALTSGGTRFSGQAPRCCPEDTVSWHGPSVADQLSLAVLVSLICRCSVRPCVCVGFGSGKLTRTDAFAWPSRASIWGAVSCFNHSRYSTVVFIWNSTYFPQAIDSDKMDETVLVSPIRGVMNLFFFISLWWTLVGAQRGSSSSCWLQLLCSDLRTASDFRMKLQVQEKLSKIYLKSRT